MTVLRGEIFTARLDPTEGSELRKTRPVLIVSNDIDNRHSPVLLVVPLTEHQEGPIYPTEVCIHPSEAGIKKASCVLCNQIRVLDKRRLCDHGGKVIRRWGTASPATMQAVNEGLAIALALA